MAHKPKCARVYVRYLDTEANEDRTVFLPCKQWKCPICGPNLVKKLRWELLDAGRAAMQDLSKGGRNMKYALKMITLTWPGKHMRMESESLIPRPEYTGDITIQDAEKIINKNWNKLKTALVKTLGKFETIKVMESQQDGYPHLHILIMGPTVSGKGILNKVRSLWRDKYGMGEVHIRHIQWGLVGGINYILKYIVKNKTELSMNMHHYSLSRGISMHRKKKKVKEGLLVVEVGSCFVRDDGTVDMKPFWEAKDQKYFIDAEIETLDELKQWFDSIGTGVYHDQMAMFEV